MENLNTVKKSFWKNYRFVICMMVSIVAGTATGLLWPGATVLEPLGTLFINAMFCVVVPMVFASIASAIANMKSLSRAGKVMGTTIITFCLPLQLHPSLCILLFLSSILSHRDLTFLKWSPKQQKLLIFQPEI